jgi:hypothetical protein
LKSTPRMIKIRTIGFRHAPDTTPCPRAIRSEARGLIGNDIRVVQPPGMAE